MLPWSPPLSLPSFVRSRRRSKIPAKEKYGEVFFFHFYFWETAFPARDLQVPKIRSRFSFYLSGLSGFSVLLVCLSLKNWIWPWSILFLFWRHAFILWAISRKRVYFFVSLFCPCHPFCPTRKYLPIPPTQEIKKCFSFCALPGVVSAYID